MKFYSSQVTLILKKRLIMFFYRANKAIVIFMFSFSFKILKVVLSVLKSIPGRFISQMIIVFSNKARSDDYYSAPLW